MDIKGEFSYVGHNANVQGPLGLGIVPDSNGAVLGGWGFFNERKEEDAP